MLLQHHSTTIAHHRHFSLQSSSNTNSPPFPVLTIILPPAHQMITTISPPTHHEPFPHHSPCSPSLFQSNGHQSPNRAPLKYTTLPTSPILNPSKHCFLAKNLQERKFESFLLLAGRMQCCSYFELEADTAKGRKHFYLYSQIHITTSPSPPQHDNITTST